MMSSAARAIERSSPNYKMGSCPYSNLGLNVFSLMICVQVDWRSVPPKMLLIGDKRFSFAWEHLLCRTGTPTCQLLRQWLELSLRARQVTNWWWRRGKFLCKRQHSFGNISTCEGIEAVRMMWL